MLNQRFIVFEGIDGCGKSTQVRLLVEKLLAENVPVIQTREPGGSNLAERIRPLLLESDLDPVTELMLLSAARRDHVMSLIKPSLEQGKTVICDRFYGSTLAYQCYGKGVSKAFTQAVTKAIIDGIFPSLTILLDVDPLTAQERRAKRVEAGNHYDARSLEFHRILRNGFLEIAQQESGWFVLDAKQDVPALAAKIYAEVKKVLSVRDR